MNYTKPTCPRCGSRLVEGVSIADQRSAQHHCSACLLTGEGREFGVREKLLQEPSVQESDDRRGACVVMSTPDWSLYRRELADGRVIDIVPLTFNRARLCVSANAVTEFFDDGW